MDQTDPLTRSLAAVVREAIDAADLSLNEAALAAGIPKTTLLRRINTPSPFVFTELSALARATGTTPAALVDRAQTLACDSTSPATVAGTSDPATDRALSQKDATERISRTGEPA